MNSRGLIRSMPVALAAVLIAAGCSKKEAEPAAPSEAAAPVAEAPAAAAPAAETVAAAPAAGDAGATAYQMYCVTCHGASGKGDGVAAASLNPKPADFSAGAFKYDTNGNGTKGDVDDIKAIVHDGAAKHGGSPLMAPWPMLSADQLQAVAEYVKSMHAG
ncbi:MAG TPA: cytochrome c [Steroidobacteraceae bacterium]|nr:cytochrome c [Steroidobacteraceae bacterium]